VVHFQQHLAYMHAMYMYAYAHCAQQSVSRAHGSYFFGTQATPSGRNP
jgi:hypothetical protein